MLNDFINCKGLDENMILNMTDLCQGIQENSDLPVHNFTIEPEIFVIKNCDFLILLTLIYKL